MKGAWDRLSSRSQLEYRNLQTYLDVSHNRQRLRELHKCTSISMALPVLPVAALISKDLTSVHETQSTFLSSSDDPDEESSLSSTSADNPVSNVVNFTKLHILSKIVRNFQTMFSHSSIYPNLTYFDHSFVEYCFVHSPININSFY